ncbi:MAG: heavy metal-binding domain-containing protein [Bacteroidota bacterium]|nr:heavy metal-binding domain-containing protein [Bacteroidota bacterium]
MKLIIIFTIISLTIACSSSNSNTGKPLLYHCPMDCEGAKNYTKSGNCPVCKMELNEVENDSTVIDTLKQQ